MEILSAQLVGRPSDAASPEIQARIAQSYASRRTKKYVVTRDTKEIGFISISYDSDCAAIYEIFVIPEFRQEGYGTKLISICNSLAIEHGRNKLVLVPRALESSPNEQILLRWYKKLGFKEGGGILGELEREVIQ